MHYDVFNGDADGICALHQLRLADPQRACLVTGFKRDIELLREVRGGEGDVVTVLDVSLDRNREALQSLLVRGARVTWFDHHYAGEVPRHPNLQAVIDASGTMCTATLVDRHLGGRHRAWAVVGAFGDNLEEEATALAASLAVDAEALATLAELGAVINYNAYGERPGDVLVAPADLYRTVSGWADPLEMARREPVFARLAEERRADLDRAATLLPLRAGPGAEAWLLPDAPWSRRVGGTFANRLALAAPRCAHAVLTEGEAGYRVSIRSPRGAAVSAVDFCRRYPTGGGRIAAAGIDRLARERLEPFLDEFAAAYHA